MTKYGARGYDNQGMCYGVLKTHSSGMLCGADCLIFGASAEHTASICRSWKPVIPCKQRKPPYDRTHKPCSTSKGRHNINGSFQDQTHLWPRLSLSPIQQSKHHPITPSQNVLAQLPICAYPLYPKAHHCFHAVLSTSLPLPPFTPPTAQHCHSLIYWRTIQPTLTIISLQHIY
jgi:hypothetical protein